MKDMIQTEVLIVGAGAAGLTLAIDLARRGIAFRLIEKSAEPFKGSRGKGIQPRTLEVFEDLGMLERMASTGGPFPPYRDYRSDGSHVDVRLAELGDPTPAEPYHRSLMLPQFLTERIMRDRLAELGRAPQYGCELVGIDPDDAGVTARLQRSGSSESLRVRYLVGADGGHSFVRHALGIGFPGGSLGVRALVADVALDGLTRDAWHRFNEGSMGRQLMFCPLAGTELFQFQAPVPMEGDIDVSPAGLSRLVTERIDRRDITIGSVSWASVYHMSARLADRYRSGRVFIIGDAAHTHPPTGGQGLNTSVQDAYNLGWKLQAVLKGAPDELLDTFEEERRPIAAGVLGLAANLLEAAKRGQMRPGREVRQLGLGYPDSSLAKQSLQARVRAGERAPDAPLRGAAGQTRRLFDLLQGPHWTLLVYAGRHAPPAPRTNLHIHSLGTALDLIDEAGHFADAYGLAPGAYVLIRPDGYIGAILAEDDTTTLEQYLAAVAVGRPH